jgi:hypothetical protein
MQRFSFWLPSSSARVCLSGLHPATLLLLLFHGQLLQVSLASSTQSPPNI